jgi:hypothetical protein
MKKKKEREEEEVKKVSFFSEGNKYGRLVQIRVHRWNTCFEVNMVGTCHNHFSLCLYKWQYLKYEANTIE